MNTYAKILTTTLPLVLFFLFAAVGTTYYFSYSAITDLAETWLETRCSEAIEKAAEQNYLLHIYGLEEIPASLSQAKREAGERMSAIQVGERGHIFVVDRNGIIVVHPDAKAIGTDVGKQKWFAAMEPGKGKIIYNNGPVRHLARYTYFEPWGWFVLATDPETEVYGTANRMRPFILALAVVCALVMATALMVMTRRLIAPLRGLMAGAERIGRGDLETRIAVSSKDEFGRLAGVFNTMSARLQETLQKLHHREEHFRSLIENATDIITILSADGTIVYASPSVEKMLAYRLEEYIGKSCFDLLHPDEKNRIMELFARHLAEPDTTVFEILRFRHGNGSYRILEFTANNLLEHPSVNGIVVNARDITERKQAEDNLQNAYQDLEKRVAERTAELLAANQRLQQEIVERKQAENALLESEQHMKAILRASPVGIGLIVNGHLDWANEAMYNMIGYQKDSLTGKSADILYADKQECREAGRKLKQSILKSEIGQVETAWVRKDGTAFECRLRAYALDPADLSKGLIVTATDISEAKKLEAELERARKMEAIGTLAGGVAHDLNNILSGIVSYPELLLLELPETSPLRKPLATIQKSGERAVAIVQDLLTMARRGVAVTEVVNLNRIIEEVSKSPEFLQLKAFHPDIRVDIQYEPDLLNVKGSSPHLSKTIMNLVANAAEAMPEGGTIAIATRNVYVEKPLRGYEHVREGDYVTVAVADKGIGIAKKDLERIFEPFYTKKQMGRSGSGLGMAVVWGTLRDHNGHIDVRSDEGRGTTFTLYLPVTREKTADQREHPSRDMYRGNGERILVVDDSPIQREIAVGILRNLGYHAEALAGGEAAVDYIKDKSVDLMILDMIMDPGIDGLETYRRISEVKPHQKAVIASGFSETDRVREAQRLGAGAYVKKPYTIETIGIVIKKELNKT